MQTALIGDRPPVIESAALVLVPQGLVGHPEIEVPGVMSYPVPVLVSLDTTSQGLRSKINVNALRGRRREQDGARNCGLQVHDLRLAIEGQKTSWQRGPVPLGVCVLGGQRPGSGRGRRCTHVSSFTAGSRWTTSARSTTATSSRSCSKQR